MTLETTDVHNFSVTEQSKRDEINLQLRGVVFHSAYAIKDVKLSTQGDELVVKVALCRGEAGLSGALNSLISIPSNVGRVTMGEDRVEIWRRGVGGMFPPPKTSSSGLPSPKPLLRNFEEKDNM
jgi:hypothetical protein